MVGYLGWRKALSRNFRESPRPNPPNLTTLEPNHLNPRLTGSQFFLGGYFTNHKSKYYYSNPKFYYVGT